MSILEAKVIRSTTKLIRLLYERVQSLEQRSPGRDPFPAAEVLAHMECLEQGIAALEAQPHGEAEQQTLAPLARRNAEEHLRGERLRKIIGQLLEQHPGPRHGTAKRIYPHLLETDIGRSEQPSLRAVQHHITQLRKSAVLRQQ